MPVQIYALGFVSVFDQVLETLPEDARKGIFNAYVTALNEKPEQYRKDAQALEQLAGALSGPEALTADASGSQLQVRALLVVVVRGRGWMGGWSLAGRRVTTTSRAPPRPHHLPVPHAQKALAQVSERSASGKLAYNKFFAIGLFRLLEVRPVSSSCGELLHAPQQGS